MGWQYRKKSPRGSDEVGKGGGAASEDGEIETGQGELQEAALKKALVSLRDRAFRYLVRREHSAWELRDKLARFDDHDLRDCLIEKLIEEDAQSDLRFAENLGRVRTRTGKGPMLLQNELQKHRVDTLIVEQVMAKYEGQWTEIAEQVRVRKFGNMRPANYKEWARQARFLQQRGFSAEHIRRADD